MSVVDLDQASLPPSVVAQVAALPVGDSYTKAIFIPAYRITPALIRDTKRRLLSSLTPILSRVHARQPWSKYRMHGIHSLTRDFDVVVAVVVVREDDEKSEL